MSAIEDNTQNDTDGKSYLQGLWRSKPIRTLRTAVRKVRSKVSYVQDRSTKAEHFELSGKTGLESYGFTCFLNAVLQALSHIEPLSIPLRFLPTNFASGVGVCSDDAERRAHRVELCFLVQRVFKELWLDKRAIVTPSMILRCINRLWAIFDVNELESHDVLIVLFESLHRALLQYTPSEFGMTSNSAKMPRVMYSQISMSDSDSDGSEIGSQCSPDSAKHLNERNGCQDMAPLQISGLLSRSVISDAVQGVTRATLECEVCGRREISFEPFFSLSLEASDWSGKTPASRYDGFGLPIHSAPGGTAESKLHILEETPSSNSPTCVAKNTKVSQIADMTIDLHGCDGESRRQIRGPKIPASMHGAFHRRFSNRFWVMRDGFAVDTTLVDTTEDVENLLIDSKDVPSPGTNPVERNVTQKSKSMGMGAVGQLKRRMNRAASKIGNEIQRSRNMSVTPLNGSSPLSLEDLLKSHMSPHRISPMFFTCCNDGCCSSGTGKVWGVKHLDILRLPEVLIFHIRRGLVNISTTSADIHTLPNLYTAIVDFPIDDLDMTPFFYADQVGTLDQSTLHYELVSLVALEINPPHSKTVVSHINYSRVKEAGNKMSSSWYEFEDENVRKVRSDFVSSRVASILFYQRKKPFINMMSAPTGANPKHSDATSSGKASLFPQPPQEMGHARKIENTSVLDSYLKMAGQRFGLIRTNSLVSENSWREIGGTSSLVKANDIHVRARFLALQDMRSAVLRIVHTRISSLEDKKLSQEKVLSKALSSFQRFSLTNSLTSSLTNKSKQDDDSVSKVQSRRFSIRDLSTENPDVAHETETSTSGSRNRKIIDPVAERTQGSSVMRKDSAGKRRKSIVGLGLEALFGNNASKSNRSPEKGNCIETWKFSMMNEPQNPIALQKKCYDIFKRGKSILAHVSKRLGAPSLTIEAGLPKDFYKALPPIPVPFGTVAVSTQWVTRLALFADPGPLCNDDIVCPHGGIKQHLRGAGPLVYTLLRTSFLKDAATLISEMYGHSTEILDLNDDDHRHTYLEHCTIRKPDQDHLPFRVLRDLRICRPCALNHALLVTRRKREQIQFMKSKHADERKVARSLRNDTQQQQQQQSVPHSSSSDDSALLTPNESPARPSEGGRAMSPSAKESPDVSVVNSHISSSSPDAYLSSRFSCHIISMAWLMKWRNFVTRQPPEDIEYTTIPEPIDNSALLVAEPSLGSLQSPGLSLRTGLVRGVDYELVSPSVWQFLHGIYGGGPPLSCTGMDIYGSNSRHSPLISRQSTLTSCEDDVLSALSTGGRKVGMQRPSFEGSDGSIGNTPTITGSPTLQNVGGGDDDDVDPDETDEVTVRVATPTRKEQNKVRPLKL
jgi:ubiquitin C-terminal hydrolase